MNDQLYQDLAHTYNKLTPEELGRFYGARVLVTGAAGFLGFYITNFFYRYRDALELRGVLCLDTFPLGKPGWAAAMEADPRFRFLAFDIGKDGLDGIPGAAEADYVAHMASIASPTFYRRYPIATLDANIWGLRALLDRFRQSPVRGILFFSSSEIYGDPAPEFIPTPESYFGNVCATGPRSCYDESKRFGETMCMLFAQQYNMPVTVVRPFNNYGPGMRLDDKRVPADFAADVLANRDIRILSGGGPTRTFCHAADAAAGYLKALVFGRYDYFNIGIESPEISIAQLAELYRRAGNEIFGYKGQVVYAQAEEREYLTHNPQRRCPVIAKARNVLGYDPSIHVEEGVARYLRFLKENAAV